MGFKSSENTLNDTTVVDTWCYLLVQTHRRMWETWVQSLGWEDTLGEGNSYPLQHSGLGVPRTV